MEHDPLCGLADPRATGGCECRIVRRVRTQLLQERGELDQEAARRTLLAVQQHVAAALEALDARREGG